MQAWFAGTHTHAFDYVYWVPLINALVAGDLGEVDVHVANLFVCVLLKVGKPWKGLYTYIHTYTHTHIHTYMHPWRRNIHHKCNLERFGYTLRLPCNEMLGFHIFLCMQKCMSSPLHICLHTYIHTYTRTCTHTYTHKHTHIHTHTVRLNPAEATAQVSNQNKLAIYAQSLTKVSKTNTKYTPSRLQ